MKAESGTTKRMDLDPTSLTRLYHNIHASRTRMLSTYTASSCGTLLGLSTSLLCVPLRSRTGGEWELNTTSAAHQHALLVCKTLTLLLT